MFEFTREFIINDNIGHLDTGKDKKFVFDTQANAFLVERMVNVRAKDIVSIHRTKALKGENESAVVDFAEIKSADIKKDDVMRLIITIREQGRVLSIVNDQYPWHSKQYFFEFTASADGALASNDATAVANVAKHNAALEDMDRLIDISASGKDLSILARDPYTRIHSIEIVKVPLDAAQPVGAVYTGYQDYVKVLDFKRSALTKNENDHTKENVPASGNPKVVFQKGYEGAGNVAQLLKNNRLLTAANIDPYGLNKDERPVPGKLYDQFVVEQVSERRHIGSQVFGAIDHSLTTYVFFVEQSIANDFEDELKKSGVAVCSQSNVSHVHNVIALDKDVDMANAADKDATNALVDAVKAAHVNDGTPVSEVTNLKKR